MDGNPIHIKNYALDFVNKLAREFGNSEIQSFQPGSLCCDTDTFTRACEQAMGIDELSVMWGETDGENHWLDFWGPINDETIARAARVVNTEWQRVDDQIVSLLEPAPLVEFSMGLLEGDFPELVPDDHDLQG